MPHAPFDVETLLQPLAEEAPSGPDMEYEPAFAAMVQAGAGKDERQYGDKVYPAEAPDWGAVYAQALALAGSTRDLRVAVWLLRSATRMHGLVGAAAGLQLLNGLLGRMWASVHPQLDASDHDDSTMRLSALAPLAALDATPADLASASLVAVRGSLTLRELELGLGQGQAAPNETTPTEAGVLQALQALLAQHADLAGTATAAAAALSDIGATLDAHLGYGHAGDLLPLTRLLKLLNGAIARLQPQASADAADAAGSGLAPTGDAAAVATGTINSRADAVRELERVCDWIERHEPGNPAPLLLRRAQRLMNKSFMDIIRDLAPDGLAQIENLAGPGAQA